MSSVGVQQAVSRKNTNNGGRMAISTAVAQWDYKANEINEISFNQGDLIEVLDNANKDWWEGRINGNVGYFPSNYVKITQKPSIGRISAVIPDFSSNNNNNNNNTHTSNEYSYENRASISNRLSSLQDADTLPNSPQLGPVRSKISAVLEAKLAAGALNLNSEHESNGRESVTSNYRVSSTLGRTATKNSMMTSNLQSVTASSSTSSLYAGPKIESVPPEIIRKEGMITIKQKAEAGGIEKKNSSWDKMFCVLCVGYFLLWKEDPSKAKKPSRPALTIYLNTVEAEAIGKDITKKKAAICLTTDDDSQYYIIPPNENEMNDWIEGFCDNSRERSTRAEYENATNKIFPTAEDVVKATIERSNTVTSQVVKEPSGSNQLFRRGTTTKSSYSDDIDKKNKMKSKLSNFFVKRPTVEALKEKGIIREDELIFGGPIGVNLDEDLDIPIIVRQCIEEVERRGVESQGIYRLSGNASQIQKLKILVNQGDSYDITDDEYGSDVLASLLKLYFRELKNPLIPYERYNDFIAVAKIEDAEKRLEEVTNLANELPKVNYDTLVYLIKHLIKVAARSDINKMEPSNLAIVFGPTLIRMPDEGQSAYLNMMNMTYHNSLMEFMINNAASIFKI